MVKVVVVAGLVGVVRSISRVGLGRRVSDWHPRYRAARAAKNVQQHKLSLRSTFCCSAKIICLKLQNVFVPKKMYRSTSCRHVQPFVGALSVCSFFASSAVAAFGGNLKRRLHHCSLFQDASHCGHCPQSHGWKRIYFTELASFTHQCMKRKAERPSRIRYWKACAVWAQYCKKFNI